jgi:hypothetical protein
MTRSILLFEKEYLEVTLDIFDDAWDNKDNPPNVMFNNFYGENIICIDLKDLKDICNKALCIVNQS